jgi:hypothetical protein
MSQVRFALSRSRAGGLGDQDKTFDAKGRRRRTNSISPPRPRLRQTIQQRDCRHNQRSQRRSGGRSIIADVGIPRDGVDDGSDGDGGNRSCGSRGGKSSRKSRHDIEPIHRHRYQNTRCGSDESVYIDETEASLRSSLISSPSSEVALIAMSTSREADHRQQQVSFHDKKYLPSHSPLPPRSSSQSELKFTRARLLQTNAPATTPRHIVSLPPPFLPQRRHSVNEHPTYSIGGERGKSESSTSSLPGVRVPTKSGLSLSLPPVRNQSSSGHLQLLLGVESETKETSCEARKRVPAPGTAEMEARKLIGMLRHGSNSSADRCCINKRSTSSSSYSSYNTRKDKGGDSSEYSDEDDIEYHPEYFSRLLDKNTFRVPTNPSESQSSHGYAFYPHTDDDDDTLATDQAWIIQR